MNFCLHLVCGLPGQYTMTFCMSVHEIQDGRSGRGLCCTMRSSGPSPAFTSLQSKIKVQTRGKLLRLDDKCTAICIAIAAKGVPLRKLSVSTTNHTHLLLNFSFFCCSYSIISASDKCLMPKVSPQVFPVDLDVGLESLAET